MQAAKRFTLENMQTYFHNYVPCDRHPQQPITNFCTETNCFRVMCPECVEQHSKQFENHYVESIKSCISRSSKKINNAISGLQADAIFPVGIKTPEEYSQKMILNLRKLRNEIIDEVNSCFDEKERTIESEIHNRWKVYQSFAQGNIKLQQAILELQDLHDSLFLTTKTVQAIKKISMVDFKSLCEHFKSQSQKARVSGNMDLNVTIDEDKRREIRRLLFGLVEVGKKPQSTTNQKMDKPGRVIEYDPTPEKDVRSQRIIVNSANKSLYPLSDVTPLKIDKGVFDITMPNTQTKQPFLHFFEAMSQKLHILPLDPLQKQLVEWKTIQLNIDFDIPIFHKSIALRNGVILLIGGSWSERKLSKIFQFQPSTDKLRQVENMLVPRSSHAIASINERVFIVGGFTDGGTLTNKCEMFDLATYRSVKIADMGYASSNSCLTAVNNRQIIKIGGMLPDNTSCHYIEIYNCDRNLWLTIDPTVENFQGEFSLLSTSGSIQINENQIFVFGGYNEQNDNEVSDMSFIFEWDDHDYRIKDINLKPLPLAEGFWNSLPVIYNKKLYCLQNVPDPDSNNCIEQRRNILVFNGRLWRAFDG